MASVNKVIVVGNLGRDPEMRYMANGEAVCQIAVATTESWKDKATGDKKEITEWHRIVFYRRLAEVAGQYLKKGAQVYVEGRLQTRKWSDKEGVERYTTEIIADTMQMLGQRGGDRHQDDDDGYGSPAPASRPAPTTTSRPSGYTAPPSRPSADDIDDMIPF